DDDGDRRGGGQALAVHVPADLGQDAVPRGGERGRRGRGRVGDQAAGGTRGQAEQVDQPGHHRPGHRVGYRMLRRDEPPGGDGGGYRRIRRRAEAGQQVEQLLVGYRLVGQPGDGGRRRDGGRLGDGGRLRDRGTRRRRFGRRPQEPFGCPPQQLVHMIIQRHRLAAAGGFQAGNGG